MAKLTLFHGTAQKSVQPTFGLGSDKHDYGRGFYLTERIELAKEWAVCRPDANNGWVHRFELDMDGLKVLDYQDHNMLCWLAELMKHRAAADSRRYRMLAHKFIQQYGIDTSGYDVIKGWRANASYFYIAKEFVRDNVDVSILEDLLFIGDSGIQYCIKSKLAFSKLLELEASLCAVDYDEFNEKYNKRDRIARVRMHEMIDSDMNPARKVFSTLVEV